MCDQSSVEYKHGDIVWVRLSPTWWPGEVVSFDTLPEEVTTPIKNKPLVTVKFFQEDNYEFIKKPADVFMYNCSMKNKFITKGLKLYRDKNKYMEKFPADICTAETRTDGDPNILNDPIFAPPKKLNLSEIFGTPPAKRSLSPKKRRKVNSAEKKDGSGLRNIITHPRFLGKDDHIVRELIQNPKGTRNGSTKAYNCSKCEFSTVRIQGMIFHSKLHLKGGSSSKKAKKASKKIASDLQLPRTKTTTITEDLELAQKGISIDAYTSSEEDIFEPEVVKKPKKKTPKRKSLPKAKSKSESKVKKDVRTDILAEWQEDSDEEGSFIADSNVKNEEKLSKPKEEVAKEKVKPVKLFDKKETKSKLAEVHDNETDSNKNDIDKGKLEASKNKSSDSKLNVTPKGKAKLDVQKPDANEETFKDILEKTSMPTIPTIPDLPKIDKQAEKSKVAKTDKTDAHPKKRFVKSFEDFELFLKNQMNKENKTKEVDVDDEEAAKDLNNTSATTSELTPEKLKEPIGKDSSTSEADKKSEEDTTKKDDVNLSDSKELNDSKEDVKNLEVSKLKSQLMNKLTTPPENNQTKNKTKAEPNSSEKQSPLKDSRSEKDHKPRKDSEPSSNNSMKSEDLDEAVAVVSQFAESAVSVETITTSSNLSINLEETLEDLTKMEVEDSEQIDKTLVDKNDSTDIVSNLTTLIDENQSASDLKDPGAINDILDEKVDEVVEEQTAVPIESSISILTDMKSEILPEEMCPLTTLAAVSELSTTIDLNLKQDSNFSEVKSPGNLTIMSENELANAEVEIAAGNDIGDSKIQPVTLTTFSVDFSDSNQSDNDTQKKYIDAKKDVVIPPEDSVNVETVTPVKEESEIKPLDTGKNSLESEMAKLTDTDPDTEIIAEKSENTSSSKLLKILTDNKTHDTVKVQTPQTIPNNIIMKPSRSAPKEPVLTKVVKADVKAKIVLKPTTSMPPSNRSNKPIILSEKILTPVTETSKVAVKKIVTKRSFSETGDIDKYIIQRPIKRSNIEEEPTVSPSLSKYTVRKGTTPTATKGKARILQQTIITAAGTVIQPNVSQAQADDSNIFDINSMPIVLSDQILTPESIENMPIVISEQVQTPTPKVMEKINIIPKQMNQQVKLLNKSASPVIMKETPAKMTTSAIRMTPKITKQRIYQSGSKLKNTSIISPAGKPGKFVIVPPASSPTGSKYTVGKRTPLIKRTSAGILGTASKSPSVSEASGNKIMILTNEQGQQSRVLLTPAQQKMFGYSSPSAKIVKSIKGNIIQKKDGTMNLVKSSPSQSIVSTKPLILSNTSSASPIKTEQTRFVKKVPPQRVLLSNTNKPPGQCRTVVIKNNKGQTIKRIQATNDALLEQQVAEQIEAINKAAAKKMMTKTMPGKIMEKKTFVRKTIVSTQSGKQMTTSTATIATPSVSAKTMSVPPLAPISPVKKAESQVQAVVSEKLNEEKEPTRAPHQLIIQDAGGYQTTITEGQILALPSETVDGQPQSYMLVTLDETGNLTPLNNEALMSLDPNLNLGGDLSNMVLQIDQGEQNVKTEKVETVATAVAQEPKVDKVEVAAPTPVEETMAILPEIPESAEASNIQSTSQEQIATTTDATTVQGITCNINNGDVNQQLLITGDPAATQKFLETLTEGNPDLANLLANAEGNILIHADGQQILINTDPDNQMLLMNSETLTTTESNESTSNPVFSSQPTKNQDILAAALADTDVFQQEPNQIKVTQSQLSPTNGMYPINVGNVLETSSMNSPIMTPLEIPSTNTKKIDHETNILSQVPKNVDLPITITDPNISQTVAQQQVASLMVNELQNNLELPLSISDPTISATSTEMNSPSNYVLSLPSLDDSDISQKPFSSSISMPLLTEENEDVLAETSESDSNLIEEVKAQEIMRKDDELLEKTQTEKSFISTVEEGLCTIRGSMCNSLSEPPPDMFDFPIVTDAESKVNEDIPMSTLADLNNQSSEESTNPEIFNDDKESTENYQSFEEQKIDTPSTNTDENSCEIPVQPEIVTDLIEDSISEKTTEIIDSSAKRSCDEDESEEKQIKKPKLD